MKTDLKPNPVERIATAPVDRYGRKISYLRMSLTDQCNLRCRYCLPENPVFRASSRGLSPEEFRRLLRVFMNLGMKKVRLTGGEPLIYPYLYDVLEELQADNAPEIALTTNGVRLTEHLPRLLDMGIRRINVSLDTLDPGRFENLTRLGQFKPVWQGIMAAHDAGMSVKLNCVPVKGVNDTEDILELARLTTVYPWQVRFIELMPFAGVSDYQLNHRVSEDQLMKRLEREYGSLTPINPGMLDGEAAVYRLPGARGTLGFISPVSKPFCSACTRIRLTADGMLRLCLLKDREVNLLKEMRNDCSDDHLRDVIVRAIYNKPWGHSLASDNFAANRMMSEIGG